MKLPELPLLDELCRAVTSAKIPAARLNQDGRRAAALCQKRAGFGCGVDGWEHSRVPRNEIQQKPRKKKRRLTYRNWGTATPHCFYVNDGRATGKSHSRFTQADETSGDRESFEREMRWRGKNVNLVRPLLACSFPISPTNFVLSASCLLFF